MTGQVLQFDAAAHKVVDALLPWYVNGTLQGDELEGVRRHLRECALCRQEAEWLRELYEACAVADTAPGAPNAFRKLRSRLEARSPNHRVGDGTTWSRAGWTRWALAASLGIAVIFGAALLQDRSAPALYRTLGASGGSEPAGSMVVVFDPATRRLFVRYEWKAARHGGSDEFEIADFLAQDGAPQAALIDCFFQVHADA